MFKKMLPWIIMILVVITLITGAAFVLWYFVIDDGGSQASPEKQIEQTLEGEEAPQISAEERMLLTVPLDNVATNLADMSYVVRLSFSFQLDSEEAKHEFELLQPSVKATTVRILRDTMPEEIQGSQGQDVLVTKMMNQLNALLLEGKVLQIEITDIIVQQS